MSEEQDEVSMRKAFGEHDLARIRRLEDDQKDFRARLKARGVFTRKEEAALNIVSPDAFQLFWLETWSTRSTFDAYRARGPGKTSQKTIEFMASTDDLLKGFRPIVEVIQDFGHPYGGLAIGTVCFLFAIAKSRSRMEEKINKTLLEIRDRLPGVEMYSHIYRADNQLEAMIQSKIVDAYTSFIHFCIEATYFYTQSTWRKSHLLNFESYVLYSDRLIAIGRWIMALGGSVDLDIKASEVQDAVVAIRRIGDELVTRNVDHIKTQNEGLKRQLQELQASQDRQNVDNMRQLLGLEPFSLDVQRERLAGYRRDIAAEFDDSDFSEKSYTDRLQAIESHPDFQDWVSHPGSRLLVLSGRNYVSDSPHCWASPVALDLIASLTKAHIPIDTENLQEQGVSMDNVCIFHTSPPRDEKYTFPGVASWLVYQLICANQRFLRNEKQATALRADLERYLDSHKRHGTVSATEEPLKRLVLTALDFYAAENQTVWIILDRVDRGDDDVSWRGRRQRDVHRRALLRMIACAVHETCATVKVLAVVNSVDWNVEGLEDDFCRSKEARDRIVIREIREEEAG